MIYWLSDEAKWRTCLVIQLANTLEEFYVMTVVEKERLTTWTLPKKDNGGTWRVFHAH